MGAFCQESGAWPIIKRWTLKHRLTPLISLAVEAAGRNMRGVSATMRRGCSRRLHNLPDPAGVVRLTALHEVDFLPPPG